MPPLPIEIHPEAIDEAREARLWYHDRNERAGNAFMRELDRALERIQDAPERWPSYMGGTRRFLFHRFPYFLVYELTGDAIRILAVAHGSRKPGYWLSRQ